MTRIIRELHPTIEVEEEYFQWLCGLVGISTPGHSYWSLGRELHKKKFYWTVPNDGNRAEDGKKLRGEFFDETGYRCRTCRVRDQACVDCLDGECSIFEMLIALSERIQDMLTSPSEGDKTADYFWELIENLGLKDYTDDHFVALMGPFSVWKILEKFLERTYTSKGHGGLFPLRKPMRDQREVEIWYQMGGYISENYAI